LDSTYTELSFLLNAATKEGKAIYLHLEPAVWDITDPKSEKNLAVCTPESRFTIPLVDNLPFIFAALKHSILAEGRIVIGWDLKPMFSWFKRNLKNADLPKLKYFDLKLLEHYSGVKLAKPATFDEAQTRVNSVTKQDNWTQATTIWQKVMKPLAMTVIPSIECEGVLNIEREARVHPCYEIEAQENGRMSCTAAFQWGVNALTIGDELGSKLRPRHLDDVFMYFDYQNMEVAVLQWLAEDDDLGEILAGDADVYETLFKRIIGGQHQNARKFAKSFFLPTIYGMSASGLAEKCKLPERLAQTVIHRLNEQFAKSFRYVERFQEDAKQGVVRDHFGRKRFFSDAYHKARNTAIQSPATAICLERLVALHTLNVSPVLMSIHDGFVVSANPRNVTDVYMAVKECLQAESSLAPGLKLKVSCKAGRSLADKEMTPIIAHGSPTVPEGES